MRFSTDTKEKLQGRSERERVLLGRDPLAPRLSLYTYNLEELSRVVHMHENEILDDLLNGNMTWKLDLARLVLIHYGDRCPIIDESGGRCYEFDLEECRSSHEILDHVMHLTGKRWMHACVLGDLVGILEFLFGEHIEGGRFDPVDKLKRRIMTIRIPPESRKEWERIHRTFDAKIAPGRPAKGHRGRRNGSKFELAKRISERDGWICGICKETIGVGDAIHIDHKIPKSLGGNGDFANLQLAHYHCNMRKGNLARGGDDA